MESVKYWGLMGSVIALTVMGTAFGNQDSVTIFQPLNRCNAFYCRFQQSFIPCHQDGKRGERDIVRRFSRNLCKYLAVGNDHRRLFAERCKGIRQSVFLNDNCRRIGIQNIPDGLLLRQNQASFRSCLVNWRNQQDKITRVNQIPNQFLLRLVGHRKAGNPFFQFINTRTGQSTDPDFLRLCLCRSCYYIRLIHYD